MNRRFLGALAVAAGLLTSVVALPAAHAAEIGTLTFTPSKGTDTSPMNATTSKGCPPQADGFFMSIKGKGLPKSGQIVTATSDAGMSKRGPFDAQFFQIMRDFLDDNNGKKLGGTYVAKLSCIDSFTQKSYGDFSGQFVFTSPTKYVAVGKYAGAASRPDIPTDGGPGTATAPAPSPASTAPAAEGTAQAQPGATPKATESSVPTTTMSVAPDGTSAAGGTPTGSSSSDDRSTLLLVLGSLAVLAVAGGWLIHSRRDPTA